MLQNAYFLAKIGADTAENEQHFAEILPIGRRVADRCRCVTAQQGVDDLLATGHLEPERQTISLALWRGSSR